MLPMSMEFNVIILISRTINWLKNPSEKASATRFGHKGSPFRLILKDLKWKQTYFLGQRKRKYKKRGNPNLY